MRKNMSFRKRMAAMLIALALVAAVMATLGGCKSNTEDDGRLRIVCSVFPEYDWVKNIVGDRENVDVSLLVSNGTDLHSYEAAPADIVKLKQSDMVISVGGVSDKWITEALEGEENVWHLRLSELPEMTLYDMSSENIGHAHGDECHTEHAHGEIDEHLWFSLRNAMYAVDCIADALCLLDGDGADVYKANAESYVKDLKGLDEKMMELSTGLANGKTAIFADRFPFVYLFEDYGLKYLAAFEGCTTDAEADFETIVRLARKIDEVGAECLLITEGSDGSLARSAAGNSQRGSLACYVLDSMQSVTSADILEGASYLSIMEQNIAVLTLSFGGAQE